MNIKTDTPLVKKAREGVMEFLLINHPLDCPICDQGGECDLQDQAMQYGSDRGRFTEVKRAVVDKNLGPLVKTVMTRCIHCTRCVRFAKEVAGIEDLGVTGRGNDSEIGTYVERTMTSELSGNVIDLCPVGALTAKPSAFTYRNWELRSTESIDTSDALGSAIRVDARGAEVMRILPRLEESINQEWISDKTRFQYDGLRYQRLTTPYVRNVQGVLEQVKWPEALNAAAKALQTASGDEIRAIAGKLADAESMVALKDLMNRLGCGDLRYEAGFGDLDSDGRSTYVFNSSISGVDDADAILLIGANPRVEAPVLNARILASSKLGVPVGYVGEPVDLTYEVDHLGAGVEALDALLKPSSPWLKRLKSAEKPMIIVGAGVLRRPDRHAVLSRLHKIVEKGGLVRPETGWNGYSVLQDTAACTAAMDVGFQPSARIKAAKNGAVKSPKVVYLLGSDEYVDDEDVPADAFVIYQGHHGERGAARADVVLPGAAFTEKWGIYVNTEGRSQSTMPAVAPLGDAREDWKVVRALSEVAGKTLPYDSLDEMRERLAEIAPHLVTRGKIEAPLWLNGEYFKALDQRAKKTKVDSEEPFMSSIKQFYQTDVISRASKTMARCVRARQEADVSPAVAMSVGQ